MSTLLILRAFGGNHSVLLAMISLAYIHQKINLEVILKNHVERNRHAEKVLEISTL